MTELINIADELTYAGFERINVGELLRFEKDGEITEFRVVNKNIDKHELWVKQVITFTPEDLDGSVRVVEQ